MSVSNPADSTTTSGGVESGKAQDVGAEYLSRATILPVPDMVYCLTHTTVHEDTLDPYGYGSPSCLIDADGRAIYGTKAMVHRRVLYRARKGDIDERRSA